MKFIVGGVAVLLLGLSAATYSIYRTASLEEQIRESLLDSHSLEVVLFDADMPPERQATRVTVSDASEIAQIANAFTVESVRYEPSFGALSLGRTVIITAVDGTKFYLVGEHCVIIYSKGDGYTCGLRDSRLEAACLERLASQ